MFRNTDRRNGAGNGDARLIDDHVGEQPRASCISKRPLRVRALQSDVVQRQKPPVRNAGLRPQEGIGSAVEPSCESMQTTTEIVFHGPIFSILS